MAVSTVKELIDSLTKNYELDQPIAYTVYSVGDILDSEGIDGDPEVAKKKWDEIVDHVGGLIEYFQSEINQGISEELGVYDDEDDEDEE